MGSRDRALIERIPQTGTPCQFVPIRFVANNRLSASDKTMAAFEALSLAKALGTKPAQRKSCTARNLRRFR